MESIKGRACIPQIDLQDAVSGLLDSGGKWSDLTITCHGREWAVHRAIICPRSSFFDSACRQPFREARTQSIDLCDDHEDAVEQMIHFFYRLDYMSGASRSSRTEPDRRTHQFGGHVKRPKLDLSKVEDPLKAAAGCYLTPASSPEQPSRRRMIVHDSPPKSSQIDASSVIMQSETDSELGPDLLADDDHLLLHCRVYAIADKYDIPPLKTLARRKFETAMACHYDSSDFPEAIEEVYNSTVDSDRGLRNIVLQAFKAHPRLATTADVYRVIQATPALAWELYRLERGFPITGKWSNVERPLHTSGI